MAGAMGMAAPEFYRTTHSDFLAMFDGWAQSQGMERGPDFSARAIAELDELMERYPDG